MSAHSPVRLNPQGAVYVLSSSISIDGLASVVHSPILVEIELIFSDSVLRGFPSTPLSHHSSLISYNDLVSNSQALRASIEQGFGNGEDALGIVIIEGD